jgi:hypothetical protein
MIKDLIRLANHLDSIGLHKEADTLDKVAITLQPDEDYDEDITNADPIIDAAENLIARIDKAGHEVIEEDEREKGSTGDHRLYAKLYEELESEIFNLAKHIGGTEEDVASQLEDSKEGSFGYYLEQEIVEEYMDFLTELMDIANKPLSLRREVPTFTLDPEALISEANKALISEPLPEAPF